jgi:hypothetical protein
MEYVYEFLNVNTLKNKMLQIATIWIFEVQLDITLIV